MLTEEQVIQLKLAHKQTREKRLADRIKAVLYVHFGLSYEEIAKLLLFDEVTVRRYCKQFEKKGIAGLLEYRYTGGQTRLTSIQEAELKAHLRDNTKRTVKEIVDHVEKTYKVKFSVIGVTKLLHRLGFTYKKPKIVPGKADKAKQAAFLKTYWETKSKLGSNDRMYFLDATHPQHNTQPSYGWILKGKANDKLVKTNSGRERLNLHGALNFNDKTAIVIEEKAINKETTIRLLETIKKQQKTGKVYLILDNASYYHARIVRRWVLHHPRFKLLFIPSYSPNLNLIERLWRFFHQKVTWNHYFETFEEFKSVTLMFFENLKHYEKELVTLLTDNFQLLPAQ
ncbi:MAG: IS630 family transposase [Patescibacteria group bacterium]